MSWGWRNSEASSIEHNQWYTSRITFEEKLMVNLPLTIPQWWTVHLLLSHRRTVRCCITKT